MVEEFRDNNPLTNIEVKVFAPHSYLKTVNYDYVKETRRGYDYSTFGRASTVRLFTFDRSLSFPLDTKITKVQGDTIYLDGGGSMVFSKFSVDNFNIDRYSRGGVEV